MMVRIIDGMLVALVLGGAVWTYQIKHSAEQSAKQIRKISAEIEAQENKITLLQADWAIMTSPERLEEVAKTYEGELELQELQSSQIVSMQELPPIRLPAKDSVMHVLEQKGAIATFTGSVPLPTRRGQARD